MIYTLTLNPSLDYHMHIDYFNLGELNIAESTSIQAGGKGINVSVVLNRLNTENTALGLVAGFTGQEIYRQLEGMNVCHDFIHMKEGTSRINVKVHHHDETEINSIGTTVSPDDISALIEQLSKLESNDYLVISGSVPQGVDKTIYAEIMNNLDKEVRVILDTRAELLRPCLKYHPFLIKPNLKELEEYFTASIKIHEIEKYGRLLQEEGARNVLVSLGKEGAFFLGEDGMCLSAKVPEITAINTIGSGDSMVAGFISEYLKHQDKRKALYLAVAAGTAGALSADLATKEKIMEVYKKIEEINAHESNG